VYHSTLGVRVLKKKKKKGNLDGAAWSEIWGYNPV